MIDEKLNKVSIVIPTYNTGKYFFETVDSALNQKYSNYEIIIVDDGSSDDTFNNAMEYSTNHANVFAFRQKNGGDSSARNFGLQNSSGKYILFLDHDDVLEMTAITNHINVFESKDDIAISVGSNITINSDSIQISVNLLEERYFDEIDIGFGITPSFSQCMYRVKDLLEIGGFNSECLNAADHDLNLRLLKKGKNGFIHENIVMRYRLHDSQQTKRPSILYNNHMNVISTQFKSRNIKLYRKMRNYWSMYYGQFIPSEVIKLLFKKNYSGAAFALKVYISILPYGMFGSVSYIVKKMKKI